MLVRRRLDCVEILHVVGKDEARHRALIACDAYGSIDEMPHLLRHAHHVHVLVSDILEQRDEIDFLLIVAAKRRTLLLTDDGDHRLVVGFGVVEAVQKMNGTRAGSRQAHADFSGELRVRARHERRKLLVTRLHETNAVSTAAKRAHDAVDAVTRISVDALHAPLRKTLQEKITDRHRHDTSPWVEKRLHACGRPGRCSVP